MQRLLVLCALAMMACSPGISDPALRSRVVLSFGSILGGDFVSVLESAELNIRSGGTTQTLTGGFGSGDSETSFDVTLNSGTATFTVAVKSTNGTTLYQGETTSNIKSDNFGVTITPQAVNAVLVVSPARISWRSDSTGNGTLRTATLRIRNAGSADLTWRVDSLVTKPAAVTMGCTDFNDHSCLTNLTRAPGPELTIGVSFFVPAGFAFTPPATLRFISNVGNVTTRP